MISKNNQVAFCVTNLSKMCPLSNLEEYFSDFGLVEGVYPKYHGLGKGFEGVVTVVMSSCPDQAFMGEKHCIFGSEA